MPTVVASIRIENVVVSATLNQKIDLKAIVKGNPVVEYRPKTFPGLVFRLKKPKTAILIFRTGKMVCTGAKSEKDSKKALSDAENSLKLSHSNEASLLKALALKELGEKEEAIKITNLILPQLKDDYLRAAAYALLEDKGNMLKELRNAIKQNKGNRLDARSDPDFKAYREDSDFKELVQEKH